MNRKKKSDNPVTRIKDPGSRIKFLSACSVTPLPRYPVSPFPRFLSIAVICALCLTFSLSHFLTFPAFAAGLGVDPGEMVVENVPLGKVVRVSELTGKKFRIKNKDYKVHTYTISILSTEETTSRLKRGYEDIPKTDWIWPEEEEVQIAGNSTREVELYVKIPKRKKYRGKKYQAIVEVKSKKDKPTDLFVLAVQPRIYLSTIAKKEVKSKKEKKAEKIRK